MPKPYTTTNEFFIRRIATAEQLAAAQEAYGFGLKESGTHWRRQVSAGACELCRSLAGPELPPSVTMYHHPGCACVQVPVRVRGKRKSEPSRLGDQLLNAASILRTVLGDEDTPELPR